MSGLGRICKKCTSLRAWSMIGARGDVGLRLKISRRRYNCVFRCSVWAYTSNYVYRMFCTVVFLGIVYGRRYVSMCIGCFVLSYLFCSTMHNFRNSYYIGSFIHTHTHTPHALSISFLGVLEPRVSLEAASLSLGVEVRCAYIPPSPDPTNSFAICGILLGMID
ncbi:hypothetical protein Hanom_Chr12g01177681 [Helianthus anomalus]